MLKGELTFLCKIINIFSEFVCCFLDFFIFAPVEQSKQKLKMKKVTFAILTAGVVFLASCGGNNDADKAKMAADSARIADSTAVAQAEEAARMQAATDSANVANAAMATDTSNMMKDGKMAPAK